MGSAPEWREIATIAKKRSFGSRPHAGHSRLPDSRTIASIPLACDTAGMSKLTFQYQYDSSFFDPQQRTDDFGRLSVTVETERFSGRGGFWVQWQDVKEFGEALVQFPINAQKPISAQWGFDMQEGNDLILRFEVSPANKRGDLIFRFEVADDYEAENRVRGWFLTNYPDLEAFRIGIARLMNREATEAVLTGQ